MVVATVAAAAQVAVEEVAWEISAQVVMGGVKALVVAKAWAKVVKTMPRVAMAMLLGTAAMSAIQPSQLRRSQVLMEYLLSSQRAHCSQLQNWPLPGPCRRRM